MKALKNQEKEPVVDHVTAFGTIASYGVIQTPALVVGEKMVSSGRVLSKD